MKAMTMQLQNVSFAGLPQVMQGSPQFHRMAASQAALPTSGEKEPAAQGRHSSWPLSGWYWPGAQRKQSEMFAARLLGMWVPAGHFCGRTDPSGQKCPSQQGPLQSEVICPDAFP